MTNLKASIVLLTMIGASTAAPHGENERTCMFIQKSNYDSILDNKPILRTHEYTTQQSFESFLKSRALVDESYLSTFKSQYGCPNWNGSGQRYHQSMFLLTTLSTARDSCQGAEQLQLPSLCQSTCMQVVESFKAIFGNTEWCVPTEKVEQRNQVIDGYMSFCQSLNNTQGCLNGLASDATSCGFAKEEETVQHCSNNIHDNCCSSVHVLKNNGAPTSSTLMPPADPTQIVSGAQVTSSSAVNNIQGISDPSTNTGANTTSSTNQDHTNMDHGNQNNGTQANNGNGEGNTGSSSNINSPNQEQGTSDHSSNGNRNAQKSSDSSILGIQFVGNDPNTLNWLHVLLGLLAGSFVLSVIFTITITLAMRSKVILNTGNVPSGPPKVSISKPTVKGETSEIISMTAYQNAPVDNKSPDSGQHYKGAQNGLFVSPQRDTFSATNPIPVPPKSDNLCPPPPVGMTGGNPTASSTSDFAHPVYKEQQNRESAISTSQDSWGELASPDMKLGAPDYSGPVNTSQDEQNFNTYTSSEYDRSINPNTLTIYSTINYQSGIQSNGKEIKRAVIAYAAQLEDEVTIELGDSILIEETFDDGWATGINLKTNNSGVFPLVCFDERASRVNSGYGQSMNKRISSMIEYK